VFAGLATPPRTDADGYSYSPAWKAKLEALGVGGLLALTPEQADAVEAFVSASATST
jgi:hypothetical protein